MLKWLSKMFKHECEFVVLGVMEASVGKEKTYYGIAICRKIFCDQRMFFPEENRAIHEQWLKKGKKVSESFERNMYMHL